MFSPRVVGISPLNSLRLNRSKKLDFPDPASPANTRRYTGERSSVSCKSSSVCYREQMYRVHHSASQTLYFKDPLLQFFCFLANNILELAVTRKMYTHKMYKNAHGVISIKFKFMPSLEIKLLIK